MPFFETEWLASVTGGTWLGPAPKCIKRISNDTRTLGPDSLYVALQGKRFDGHSFLAQAFEAGALGALVDRGRSKYAGHPLLEVDCTQAALSALGASHRARVSPLVVGVTGSAGKSTVKEMTAAAFGAAGETARTRGNWNNEIGLPLSLLAMESKTRFGVFEIGMNHPGELQGLCRVLKPDWGAVTNVGPVHLEFFESVDAIAHEKAELLRSLPADGKAFLCRDDAYFEFLRGCAICDVKTVSFSNDADLVVIPDEPCRRLTVSEPSTREKVVFDWVWPGRHNALNAGFAILIGRAAGLSWEKLKEGLALYRPLPMRWEECRVGGCLIINDSYNANPTSMRAAIETFARYPVTGRKWLVLGDMLELGVSTVQAHENLGFEVGAGAWAGIVAVGSMGVKIADGAYRRGFHPDIIWRCENAAAAANVLKGRIEPGDAVLIKASRGMTLEKVIVGLGD